MRASDEGHLDVVKTLIETGASVNDTNKVGKYLHCCCTLYHRLVYTCLHVCQVLKYVRAHVHVHVSHGYMGLTLHVHVHVKVTMQY